MAGSAKYYLTDMLTKLFVDEPFELVHVDHKPEQTFRDLSTIAELWQYLRHPFLTNIYGNNESGLSINSENTLMGPPRLRQLRVANGSCSIHIAFQRNFYDCYGDYSVSRMDYEPFGVGEGTA